MTDLAKLASEITPGPWNVFSQDSPDGRRVEYLEIQSCGKVEVVWWENPTKAEIINATAMAMVPKLIAEVLRLREEQQHYSKQQISALRHCQDELRDARTEIVRLQRLGETSI